LTIADTKSFKVQALFQRLRLLSYGDSYVTYASLHLTSIFKTLPFGRICFVVLVMRKRGESSWSGPWHFGCRLHRKFSMCTATRTSSYSPVGL